MRTPTLVLAILLTLSARAAAQVAPQAEPTFRSPSHGRHRVFLELAGNSAFGFTVNYELGVTRTLGVRLGYGQDLYSDTKVWPFTLAALVGNGSSKFELSGGVVMVEENMSGDWDWDGTRVFATGFIGYRFQPRSGFLFRVGVIPLLWTNNQLPWVGLSLGTVF
ncbi:MAG: hypothetical protein JSW46_01745 [Gemmatimonadota bacterium]|nr:MAG: hypothetical protein JSW46_01745 [Gemmatimonadota bacterium]